MSQNFTWPSVSVSATNPSVGVNGATAPAQSTEVSGINPSGNLNPLQTDASGNLLTSVASSALPAGAATSANQTSEIALLTSLDGKTVHVDTGAVVVASSALPAGASTSALQTSGNASLSSIDGKTPALGQALAAGSVPIVLTAAQLSTLTPLTTVTVVQPTGSNLHVAVDSSALPSGASTSALQTSGNASLTSIDSKTPALGQALAAASVPVVLTAIQSAALATSANQTSQISQGTTALSRLAGSLVPTAYDEIVLTYTAGNITLAEYKLATVLVKTLTLTYTGSDLTGVVAS